MNYGQSGVRMAPVVYRAGKPRQFPSESKPLLVSEFSALLSVLYLSFLSPLRAIMMNAQRYGTRLVRPDTRLTDGTLVIPVQAINRDVCSNIDKHHTRSTSRLAERSKWKLHHLLPSFSDASPISFQFAWERHSDRWQTEPLRAYRSLSESHLAVLGCLQEFP